MPDPSSRARLPLTLWRANSPFLALRASKCAKTMEASHTAPDTDTLRASLMTTAALRQQVASLCSTLLLRMSSICSDRTCLTKVLGIGRLLQLQHMVENLNLDLRQHAQCTTPVYEARSYF